MPDFLFVVREEKSIDFDSSEEQGDTYPIFWI